jgi:hypothetical protein
VAAQARGLLRFLDPADEGFFSALAAVLGPLPLSDATALVARGAVVDEASGAPVRWRPAPMVLPVSPALRARVEGPAYDARVEETAAAFRLRVVTGAEPKAEERAAAATAVAAVSSGGAGSGTAA